MRSAALPDNDLYYDPYDYAIDLDPHPIWARLREERPLYWNDRYQFWALSRFQDVWNAYHDTTTYSSSHGVTLDQLDEPLDFPTMIFMDPPEHDILRKLVSRAFTTRRIRDLEESVTELVSDYLDPFVGESGFDYVADFGALLPPVVIGELLGIPVSDRDLVRRWFDELLHHNEGETGPSEKAVAAGLEMFEYVHSMIEERRKRPADDMITGLMEAEMDDNGSIRRLDEVEVVSFISLLAGAGVETVARLLSWAAVTLARNPDQRSLLTEDAALVPNAIEELLRYEAPSPVNARWITREVELYGVTIPADSKMLLLNASADRDPREFEAPDQFDVRRQAKRHIAFGYGAHFCLGAALARMEGRVALSETLKRFPTWEVDESKIVPVHTTSVRGFSEVPIHFD